MTETVYESPASEIIVKENRQRRIWDIKELANLKDSFESHGQLQPGVCMKTDEGIVLIAGWRRLQCCKQLDIPYKYLLLDEIQDPIKREEMELHENLMREQLDFKDVAAARDRLHALFMSTKGTMKIKGKPSWSLEKTAQELKISATVLADDIEYAQFAKKIPSVAQATTKSEAKKIIKSLKNQVLQDEAIRQIKARETVKLSEKEEENKTEKQKVEDQLTAAIQSFSKHIFHGNFEEILTTKFEGKTFEIVFFDPPWGVDFQDVFQLSGKQKGYSDKRKTFFKNLENNLKLLYNYMSPDSILFFKFGITSHFWVVRTLTRVGFQTNGIPLIWRKPNQRRTRSPERYFGRCYEPILIAHKGAKPIQMMGKQDYIEADGLSPTLKDIHPSAMNPKVPYELFSRVVFPGDKILDPMAGSGMTGVAAEELNKTIPVEYFLIDQDKSFCNLMIKNLLTGYQVIINPAPEEPSADFRQLKPGSPEWVDHWQKHPEDQEKMMAFMGKES